MRLTRYQKILKETGAYDTDSAFRPTIADRFFGWSAIRCHLRIVWVIIRANIRCHLTTFDRYDWSMLQERTLRYAEGAGGKATYEGVPKILNAEGPFVYAANHMSLLETFTLPLALLLAGPIAIVVKESLLNYPVFGKVLRTVASPIAVTRKNARQDLQTVMEQGQAAIESGKSVLIFPQSTRSRSFDVGRFNSIAARLARRANVPLVPVALRTDFMGLGRIIKDFGPLYRDRPIRFRIGDPIPPSGNVKELHAKAVSFIRTCMVEWGIPIVGEKNS